MDVRGVTVVTLGECLVDLIATSPGTLTTVEQFEKRAGGAPANVAACVSKLGGSARFVGRRGADEFGTFLDATLRSLGVDTRFFRETRDALTGLALVAKDKNGDSSYLFYRQPAADMLLEPADIGPDVFEGAAALYLGSVSLAAEPIRSAAWHAVEEAAARGIPVAMDLNWRPALWPDPAAATTQIERLLPYCIMVKVNREELQLFAGTTSPEDGAAYFHKRGISLVLVTLDADGCFYSHRASDSGEAYTGYVQGMQVDVVDTTGAGDAFMGAFLQRFAGRESELSQGEIVHRWLEFAVAVSGMTVTRRGAMAALPSLDDVHGIPFEILPGGRRLLQ